MPGRDPEDRTRQLCTGWKSDTVVAAQALSERIGRLAAQLAGYRGVRILQDNVLWKPPGSKALGFHQDSSYADYLVPPEMVTCWMSLHDTEADAGPLAFVPGSHRWRRSPPERSQPVVEGSAARLHDDEGRLDLRTLRRGRPFTSMRRTTGSQAWVWHGSAPNTSGTVARMALVSHMVPVEARFHETKVDVTYSRYRRRGDLSLDQSFFPVMWDESGRTPWLDALSSLD